LLTQPATAIAHDMAQSVTSFEANARSAPEPSPRMPSRLDGVIPDSKKLSAQGARPAVAIARVSQFKTRRQAALLVQRHRNANFVRR
jgi:hypothetical protein